LLPNFIQNLNQDHWLLTPCLENLLGQPLGTKGDERSVHLHARAR